MMNLTCRLDVWWRVIAQPDKEVFVFRSVIKLPAALILTLSVCSENLQHKSKNK